MRKEFDVTSRSFFLPLSRLFDNLVELHLYFFRFRGRAQQYGVPENLDFWGEEEVLRP